MGIVTENFQVNTCLQGFTIKVDLCVCVEELLCKTDKGECHAWKYK